MNREKDRSSKTGRNRNVTAEVTIKVYYAPVFTAPIIPATIRGSKHGVIMSAHVVFKDQKKGSKGKYLYGCSSILFTAGTTLQFAIRRSRYSSEKLATPIALICRGLARYKSSIALQVSSQSCCLSALPSLVIGAGYPVRRKRGQRTVH